MKPFALGALAALIVAACAQDLAPAKCGEIPAGGCPRRDDACVDPACAAVYFCSADSRWTLDRTCAARDASAPETGLSSADGGDAGALRDVSIDVPGASGGPGCEDLSAPDCSLAVALSCGQGCCGCEDLFVCEGGGWSLWGSCQSGVVVADARDH